MLNQFENMIYSTCLMYYFVLLIHWILSQVFTFWSGMCTFIVVLVCSCLFFGCVLDFLFVGQAYLSLTNFDSNSDSKLHVIYQVVFILSLFFLLFPIILNLLQLNKEVRNHWLNDVDTKEIIESWLRSHGYSLIFISLVSGSSFSAIELCNSYLFKLDVFCMNLPIRHKQIYKTKRVLSIVLFENIPQLCIQNVYLFYSTELTYITLFSIIFSVLSIVSSFFEVSTKKYVLKSESILYVKFIIESKHIETMTKEEFLTQIIDRRHKICDEIGKILGIDFHCVELLKPLHLKNGASVVFHIRNDRVDSSNALKILTNEIQNNRLGKAVRNVYKLKQFPQIMGLETKLIGPSADENTQQVEFSIKSKAADAPKPAKVPKLSVPLYSDEGQ